MLFEGLTQEEKKAIEKIGRAKTYKDGETIIRENESGDSLFVILSGQVQVRKAIDSGRNKNLKDLGPGEFFGEMSFFRQAPRSADVLARGECRLLELPMDRFDQLTRENPVIGCKIYQNMARELTVRLRANNEELKKALLWAIEGWTYM